MKIDSQQEPIAILGVKSSSNQKIYTVVIWKDGLSCNCPAAGIGGLCKHLKNILHNNPEFLDDYTKENDAKLRQKLADINKQISKEVLEIAKEIENIQKSNTNNKKELIAPLKKQIIKISTHTRSDAFMQAKTLNNNEIITTSEELQAFDIIKSILNTDKITYTDHKNFFNIKNASNTFCRLYFNGVQKSITFIENFQETHHAINNVNDLYNYADLIKENYKTLSYK